MTIQTIDIDLLSSVTGGDGDCSLPSGGGGGAGATPAPPKTFGDSAFNAASSAYNGVSGGLSKLGSSFSDAKSSLMSTMTGGRY
jgi:hypothetical protein